MSRHVEIQNTSIPYRSNADITSQTVNLISGSKNILTTARQLMERRPGFADSVEANPTTFTNVVRHIWFTKWGTGGFYSIVNDISGGFSKIYKMLLGTDANYSLIFTSSTADPFDFAISNNTLFMGNGTDMRKYISGASTTKWGITAPSAAVTVASSGTGISAFSGWFWFYTYASSVTGHESSVSPISVCSQIITNKTMQIGVAASADGQVDQIRAYRTTDGGSQDPTLARELSNSPFPNIGWTFTSVANASAGSTVYTGTPSGASGFASSVGQTFTVAGFTTGANNGAFACTASSATTLTLTNAGGVSETHAATGILTVLDTTPDTSLSTRTAPGYTTNDPPTPSDKLTTDATGGRIFTAQNASTYFSAQEELPANGSPWECFPSGADGNSYSWPQEVQAQATQADGVGVLTRGKIWKIAGNLRNNFIQQGLLDRRGTISVTAVASLGNSVAWLDTASQVFLDGQEIGFDIRTDIKNIDHSQAYLCIHISGRFHWVCLLDGANGKIYVYDMDTQQWLPPFTLPGVASALSSGESSAGVVTLTVALGKTKMYNLNISKFNDGGSAYSAVAATNIIDNAEADEKPSQPFRSVVVETDSNLASKVEYILDDDPTTASAPYVDISSNVSDPVGRENGVNLVKKIYQPEDNPNGERVGMRITWPTLDQSFTCYTITLNDPNVGG